VQSLRKRIAKELEAAAIENARAAKVVRDSGSAGGDGHSQHSGGSNGSLRAFTSRSIVTLSGLSVSDPQPSRLFSRADSELDDEDQGLADWGGTPAEAMDFLAPAACGGLAAQTPIRSRSDGDLFASTPAESTSQSMQAAAGSSTTPADGGITPTTPSGRKSWKRWETSSLICTD
jgi:hypothetical protein